MVFGCGSRWLSALCGRRVPVHATAGLQLAHPAAALGCCVAHVAVVIKRPANRWYQFGCAAPLCLCYRADVTIVCFHKYRFELTVSAELQVKRFYWAASA